MKPHLLPMSKVVSLSLVLIVLSACAEMNRPIELPKAGAQAQAGAPASAQVALISIPTDASLPNFTVTVEPFQVAAQDIRSGGGATPLAPNRSFYYSRWGNQQSVDRPESNSPQPMLDDRLGVGIAVQLLSTLSRVGNITVIDYETYRSNPGQFRNIYLIKGTITEFAETNEASDQKKSFTTLPGGMVVSDIGRAVGSNALSLIGTVAMHSDITTQQTATQKKGSVGLDIQVVNTGSGQIISSFPSQGTFTTQSATKENSVLGYSVSSAAYQASAIGQAQRVALNDATSQIFDTLKQKGR